MKRTQKLLVSCGYLVLAVSLLFGFGENQQTAGALFEKALFLEEARGELQEAIDLYQQIVDRFSEDRETAAKAQLHIGICYEKLGRSEATKAYELVLKNFADQSESVSTAQARLSGLRQEISVESNVLTLIPDTSALRIMPTSLSPDGSKMAALDMSNGLNIAIVDCVTNKIERLTSYGWNDGMIYYGVWSPDGNEIAFIRTGLKETDPAELMAITLDGKSRMIYGSADSGIIPCDWTPDGKYILGVMGDAKPSFTLGLIPDGGGTFEELFSFGASFDVYFARPAVSPDGQYILFEAGEKGVRNIHILKLENKKVSVIADHPADDYQPLWSPDGRHVVFLSRRHGNLDLWGITIENGEALEDPFLVKEDVQEMNLLNWRRSGLAYVNTFMLNDIFVVPVDQGSLKTTGSAIQIAYIPTGNNRVPVWSPDGKHLAFCSSDPADSSIYLVLLSEDPGEFSRFSVPAYKFGQLSYFPDLRWKPDGSGLSFTGEPEKGGLAFFQFKIDGEEWREDPLSGLVWTRSDWTFDGNSYIYAVHGFFSDNPGIVEKNLSTGTTRHIYRPDKDQGNVFRGLRFSRDHEWIAFQEDNTRIVVFHPETGTKKILTEEGFEAPSWSPDGRHLVVIGGKENNNGSETEMFFLSVEDGSVTKIDLGKNLPQGAGLRSPDWSPDGTEIVFETMVALQGVQLMRNVIPDERR